MGMKQKPKTFVLALAVDGWNEWYVAFSKNKTFRVAAETLWWGRLSDSIWAGLSNYSQNFPVKCEKERQHLGHFHN